MDRRLRDNITHLYISSYKGISTGAIHSYGELQYDDFDRTAIVLRQPMLAREATRQNKESMRDFGFHSVEVGELTSGFKDDTAVIKFALAHWQEHGDERILVLGRTTYDQPKLVLATTVGEVEPLRAAAKVIVEKCEAIGWFDDRRNDELMNQYIDEWDKLLLDHLLKYDDVLRVNAKY